MKRKGAMLSMIAVILVIACMLVSPTPAVSLAAYDSSVADESGIIWGEPNYEEYFDSTPNVSNWVIDDYTKQDDIYFGENRIFIRQLWDLVGGEAGLDIYTSELNSFTSFRQSYTYGKDGWLTIETYGRGKNGASEPDSGGKFVVLPGGGAKLICEEPTDAVIIRSTEALPDTYKLEVTVTAIDVGGKNYDPDTFWEDPHWTIDAWTSFDEDGVLRMNGYEADTALSLNAGPWRPSGDTLDPKNPFAPSYDQNGGYFLSIVDYADPKPHNNLFLHHNRKVAMDTDNNVDFIDGWGGPWSKVWNGTKYVDDGSRYISMLWANGNKVDVSPEKDLHRYLEYLMTGQKFYTFNPSDKSPRVNTVEMVDKYIPGNEYTFTIERTPEYYKMSVKGVFFYGGDTTYEHTKYHLPSEKNGYTYTWHFNQTTEELQGITPPSDTLYYNGVSLETWPANGEYPDYFFTGMPHINYYEGSMTYSSLKLYYPKNA